MKRFWCVMLVWGVADLTHAFIPNSDWLVGQMAEVCLSAANLKGVKSQEGSLVIEPVTFSFKAPTKDWLGPVMKQYAQCSLPKKADRAQAMSELLKKLQVDLATVSLQIFEGEPVYVLGASPTEKDKAQVWIDTATFLPVTEISAGIKMVYSKWVVKNPAGLSFPSIIQKDLFRLSLAEPF
jgi:hypothetical protein